MKRSFFLKFFGTVALLSLAVYVGYFFGTHKVRLAWKDFTPIVASENQLPPDSNGLDMSLFYTVLSHLNSEYYDKSKIDSNKIVYGAISGALESLGDPYTSFFPPKENKEFKDSLAGEFSGIGAELGLNDEKLISIVAPLDGSPAQQAGIRSGDVILKVNGDDTYGWTIAQAVENIRGPRGSQVTLTVARADLQESEDIPITRDTIQIDSVKSWLRQVDCEGGKCEEVSADACPECAEVAYIRVSQFGDRTNKEWLDNINELSAQVNGDANFQGIVVDLRNNPGGYMQDAVFIASEFVKNGVIVTQENGQGGEIEFPVSRPGVFLDTPLVVLVNGGSASASEIVTGALVDYNRATVVGEQTFGKGTIQKSIDFRGGESIHVTIAKWLTPEGTWVHETGITPDVVVEYSEEQSLDRDFDNQLSTAISTLLGK